MTTVRQPQAPVGAECFLDSRDDGTRALVVRWAAEGDHVVLALWRGAECVGTFRLTRSEVPAMLVVLQQGLVATTR